MVGSGLHVNLSLAPIGGGPNAYFDTSDRHGSVDLARQSIAGLIEHHDAVAGWSAPLVNSYKRLHPGMIAGYWANWGLDNRSSTYRVPGERGAATRIENRMPCGTANPYLAAAAMLNAALLGVDGDRLPGPAGRRRRQRAEHRPAHTAHARRGARRARGRQRHGRGDGIRGGAGAPRAAPRTSSAAGRRPARRGTPSRSPTGSSPPTCPTTDLVKFRRPQGTETSRDRVGVGLLTSYSGAWQTASTLLPSGSRTNAP